MKNTWELMRKSNKLIEEKRKYCDILLLTTKLQLEVLQDIWAAFLHINRHQKGGHPGSAQPPEIRV